MHFTSGSISTARLRVTRAQPAVQGPSEEFLAALRSLAFTSPDIGVPAELEYGFSGGRHVLDTEFSFEHNIYGDFVLFGLRLDTNKPPASHVAALRAIEEQALAKANPTGFASKAQKADAKEAAQERINGELRAGKHRRSRLVPIAWDTAHQVIYTAATGKALECLVELLARLGIEVSIESFGAVACRYFEAAGKQRDYEDLRPTRFVLGPEGEGQAPEYPWVAKGPQPKDFLGNEFALWLWHRVRKGEEFITDRPQQPVTAMIDKALDVECAFGQQGRDAFRGNNPDKMPEVRDALRTGKLPRRMGLVWAMNSDIYGFVLHPETLAISSAHLPEVEADTKRELIDQRLERLRSLYESIDFAACAFLQVRASPGWEGRSNEIRTWINEGGQR